MLGGMLFGGSGCGPRPARQEADPAGTGSAQQDPSAQQEPPSGGLGFLDILLLAGLAYLGFRFLAKRRMRQERPPQGSPSMPPQAPPADPGPSVIPFPSAAGGDAAGQGIGWIRRMDPSFDEKAFGDHATDLFFRLQGAWARRELAPVSDILTEEMRATLQADVDGMKAEGHINRLENIAVRSVEIAEAWQESGQDYLTVRFLANLLDYTTDEAGKVVSGSDSVPVKFEEYWTFARPVGAGPWKLAAIQQP
jgi:predicted lipid-binding transport protein (Tim44 family)